MNGNVRITEVGLRDGLQNEPEVIATTEKVRLAEMLMETGVDEVEVSSFVSAKWVPQLGDAADVFAGVAEIVRRGGNGKRWPMFSALVPNEKGLMGAIEVNKAAGFGLIGKVAVFTAASETFSRKNTNATIAETIERFGPVMKIARGEGMKVRGYVSCVVACPFEGEIEPRKVAEVARRLIEVGVDEIDLGDTIGAGTPESVGRMLEAVRGEVGSAWWGNEKMTLHLHDTKGMAGACVKKSLELGVRSFDSSVAGLGGCPYASRPGKRAPGNISTQVLVKVVEDAGYVTGVKRERLAEAADFARKITGNK